MKVYKICGSVSVYSLALIHSHLYKVQRMCPATECYVLFQYIQGLCMTEAVWCRRLTAESCVQYRVCFYIRATRIQSIQISLEKFKT